MNTAIAERLRELDLELPTLPPPKFNYVPGVRTGTLVFASGQTPTMGGRTLHQGRLGAEVDIETGRAAARLAALNVLAELEMVAGLEKVSRIVRLAGYVASAEGFVEQPAVVNGASDVVVEVLGEAGRHSRVAIGVAWLPDNAPVEIEITAEVAQTDTT